MDYIFTTAKSLSIAVFIIYFMFMEQFKYSKCLHSPWSKLKIVTIQWIKSRIWDTIDDLYINNHTKNQVSVVFIHALFAEVYHQNL